MYQTRFLARVKIQLRELDRKLKLLLKKLKGVRLGRSANSLVEEIAQTTEAQRTLSETADSISNENKAAAAEVARMEEKVQQQRKSGRKKGNQLRKLAVYIPLTVVCVWPENDRCRCQQWAPHSHSPSCFLAASNDLSILAHPRILRVPIISSSSESETLNNGR